MLCSDFFFKKIFIYLAARGLSCGIRDLCITWSLLLQCTDSLVVVRRLSSCGVQALCVGHMSSETHRLSSCGVQALCVGHTSSETHRLSSGAMWA